jgi:hypothetical protein
MVPQALASKFPHIADHAHRFTLALKSLSLEMMQKTTMNIINEDIEYDPSKLRYMWKIVLVLPELHWNFRLQVIRELVNLGIPSFGKIYSEPIATAAWFGCYDIIEELHSLGLKIYCINFLCLMMDPNRIDILQHWSNCGVLRFTRPGFARAIHIAIIASAWNILDFLLTLDVNLKWLTNRPSRNWELSIIPELMKHSEDIFLKYAQILHDKYGFQMDEYFWITMRLAMAEGKSRSFQFIIDHTHRINPKVFHLIVRERNLGFLTALYRVDGQDCDPLEIVKTLIRATWMEGLKWIVETRLVHINIEYCRTIRTWFINAHKPRNSEKMQIYHYLRMALPDLYNAWLADPLRKVFWEQRLDEESDEVRVVENRGWQNENTGLPQWSSEEELDDY